MLIASCLVLFSLLFVSSSVIAFATSPLNKTYGGAKDDAAYSILNSSDGGYVLAGYTKSFGVGGMDVWLVNSSGQMIWNKTYGGTGDDVAYSLIQAGNGEFVFAGYSASFGMGGSDVWLVKTDSAGNVEWNQTYGGEGQDESFSVVQANDGGYLVAGSTNSSGAGQNDFWLVKTEVNGKISWNQTYGGVGEEVARSVVQASDGGYTVTGYRRSLNASAYDIWVVKTDSAGVMLWNKTFGGAGHDGAFSILQTSDGGYALAGGTVSSSANRSDVWLVKIDSFGSMQWNRTFVGNSPEAATSLIQTSDGGYAIAAITESYGAGSQDGWLIKTDAVGGMTWNQTYGKAGSDAANAVVQTSDGGYALAGFMQSDCW